MGNAPSKILIHMRDVVKAAGVRDFGFGVAARGEHFARLYDAAMRDVLHRRDAERLDG